MTTDDELRRSFAALRDADRATAPAFARIATRPARRWGRWGAALAVAAAIVLWIATRPARIDGIVWSEPTSTLAALRAPEAGSIFEEAR